LITAGTGNSQAIVYDSAVRRSDSIFWLDKRTTMRLKIFFEQIEAFISYLNESCYTGITGYEFHYSLYEKEILFATF
jgi:SM-20-related protein